jgi:predicted nucleic-acid-binding Zn-ribbon protein
MFGRKALDEQLAQRFLCSKCEHHGAHVKRFAATGTGLSKMFDIQHNQFIAASCQNCGYTEIYNPEIMEGKSSLSDVFDVIFGG